MLPASPLVGPMLGEDPALAGVRQRDHGGAAHKRLHDPESAARPDKDPLAEHDSRLAGQAAIHIGHDRRGLLMPGEDEADLVAMVVDGIEQGLVPPPGMPKT